MERNQQIAVAFDQAHHGVVLVQRNQAALDRAKVLAQAGDPGRKKGEGQAVRHSELDHILTDRGMAAQHGTGALQRLQHLQRLGVKGFAGGGEARRVGAAVHQIGTGPGFQRLDTARKGGLGDVAQLRGTAEAAGFGEADEVL